MASFHFLTTFTRTEQIKEAQDVKMIYQLAQKINPFLISSLKWNLKQVYLTTLATITLAKSIASSLKMSEKIEERKVVKQDKGVWEIQAAYNIWADRNESEILVNRRWSVKEGNLR